MKINPGAPSIHRNALPQDSSAHLTTNQKSFADYMRQQTRLRSQEQLHELLKQIEWKGSLLTRSLTVRDLYEYKRFVREFLDAAVRQGIGLKETRGYNRRGRGKRYVIIEEVDRHLLALTDQMLADESKRLELLHRIGEIRGLLIHLLY